MSLSPELSSMLVPVSGPMLINIQHFHKPDLYYNKRPKGPRVAHLSSIASADMQMLCNIFPILSSQQMKRLSFKQFLILNFEKEYYIWHDSQWSVIIWTNSQSHFNSRINVKFGCSCLSGFWRIMILYMYTAQWQGNIININKMVAILDFQSEWF